MRAYPLLPEFLPTVSAPVFIAGIPTHLLHKKPDEASQKQVTDINVRGQDEEEVAEDAARHQPQQIENGGGRSELAEQIVEHGQRDDNKQPDAQQKNRKDERHLERRKGGIKVEMLPGIGDKHLHRLVNRSTERHQQTEEKRIDAVDIIEVNHLQLLLHESTEQVGPDKEGENDDEIRSVSIAEKVDKLRNTIGGHEGAHQITVGTHPWTSCEWASFTHTLSTLSCG